MQPHKHRGVYFGEKQAGLGEYLCVGMPGVKGGPTKYLLVNSLLCKKVELKDLPKAEALEQYEGEYGTVLERFAFKKEGTALFMTQISRDQRFSCVYVEADTFSSPLGAVRFVRKGAGIIGVCVGSSTCHNRIRGV